MFESVPNRVKVIEMGGITVLSKVCSVEVLMSESQQTSYCVFSTVVLNVFLVVVVVLLLLFAVAGGRSFVFFA